MPIYSVRHVTTYRYRQPVAFGEHRMMLTPREGHDQRLLSSSLTIVPEPASLRFSDDALGNRVGVASFSGRADTLVFEVEHPRRDVALASDGLQHRRARALAARRLRCRTSSPIFAPIMSPRHRDPAGALERWARSFLRGRRTDADA